VALVREADRRIVALDFEHVLEGDGHAVHWSTERSVSDTTVRNKGLRLRETSDETYKYP
jgi:hypothetical protein